MAGDEKEVVRLAFPGEDRPSVNVLATHIGSDDLTLVCPFPALALDVPVRLALRDEGNDDPVEAYIRRIGVEMTPESDIPRLKLEVAVRESELAADEESIQIDVDENDGWEADDEDVDDTRPHVTVERHENGPIEALWVAQPIEVNASSEEDHAKEIDEFNWPISEELNEGFSLDGEVEEEDDPPWATFDGAPPEPSIEHMIQEERSRWPVKAAVTLALLLSVAAVAYVLRQQVTDIVTPYLGEGLAFQSTQAEPETETVALASTVQTEAPVATTAALPPEQDEATPPVPVASLAEEAAEVTEEALRGNIIPAVAEDGENTGAAVQNASASSTDTIRLMLPTQWPVTEATSYRLQGPSGIVVDVPGGLAGRSARWIDTTDERIRAVRVVERASGVRFIITLNDEVVPRYRVGYGRSGVTIDILGPDSRHTT